MYDIKYFIKNGYYNYKLEISLRHSTRLIYNKKGKMSYSLMNLVSPI